MLVVGALVKRRGISSKWTHRHRVISLLGRAIKRYDMHRNNVTVSLIDASAAIYPAVQRVTGKEFFRAMARFHVRATPPASPLLFDYGRAFPAFIEGYEYAREMPWLVDTARIERAWLDVYHAEDCPTLTAEALSLIHPSSLAGAHFVPHPPRASCDPPIPLFRFSP